MEPPYTLPEVLFNAGYDVWIAYARGTKYSRTHTLFDPDSDDPDTGAAKYWDFAINELATLDISTLINEVLETREAEGLCQKVKVLSHDGQGLTNPTILLNENPTVSEQVIDLALNNGFCAVSSPDLLLRPG